jgi:hypothetical protein
MFEQSRSTQGWPLELPAEVVTLAVPLDPLEAVVALPVAGPALLPGPAAVFAGVLLMVEVVVDKPPAPVMSNE